MKRKVRDITIADKTYTWLVSSIDSNFVCLKVWLPGSRSVPWMLVRYQFNDPWLHFGELISLTSEEIERHFQLRPIQPSHVARIITSVNELCLTKVGKKRKTLHFECDAHGMLTTINDVHAPTSLTNDMDMDEADVGKKYPFSAKKETTD